VDTRLSRREQTRRENRRALVAAARRVFADIGFEAATIRDIVEESGLSRGTFYNYMGDKETAFRAVTTELVDQIRAAVSDARASATDLDGLVIDAFRAMVGVLANDDQTRGLVTKNGPVLRAVVGDLGVTQIIADELIQDLDRAAGLGIIRARHTDWLAAAMLGAAIEVVTRIGPDDDVTEVGDFLAAIFLGGVRALSNDPASA
jgi:AcrR family transcriptional regulator